jgi:hypothetical protein
MKKLLPLFALICLVGNAAPKPKANPQIVLGLCTPVNGADCDPSQPSSLVVTGLDPHKLYEVSANGGAFDPGGILSPASESDVFNIDISGLAPGTYTFTLYQVNHNATPHVEFAPPVIVTFDNPPSSAQ